MNTVLVNGISIRTDKPGIMVNGDIVVFGDGSTYNISTGEYHNRGYYGEVFVNGVKLEESDGSRDESKNHVGEEIIDKNCGFFTAQALDLRVATAHAEVQPWSGGDIQVRIHGPKSLVDAIDVKVVGGTLVVAESQPRGSSNSFGGITVSGGSVVIGNGSVSFGSFGGGGQTIVVGNDSRSRLRITIQVPTHTPISAHSTMGGDIVIGDIEGPLSTLIQGSGDIVAGKMTDLSLRTQGSGDTDVAHATGNVVVTIQGSGDTTISAGSVRKLSVAVQGSGDVNARVTAQSAELTVAGSGDITVSHVINPPSKSVRGSGDIRVRKVG